VRIVNAELYGVGSPEAEGTGRLVGDRKCEIDEVKLVVVAAVAAAAEVEAGRRVVVEHRVLPVVEHMVAEKRFAMEEVGSN
jgi:hypothetical protein